MSQQTVAYRYAKSLLGLATEKGVESQVFDDMKLFAQVCDENDEFVAVMKNPIVSHRHKHNILKGMFEGKVNAATMTIFDIIVQKNRENLLTLVAHDYVAQYEYAKGIQKAYVTSAAALTDAQKESFKKVVADATGRSVILIEKIDEKLIGGYILRVNDRQIDTSVKTKLNDLKVRFAQ
jgi:F-type H+-transporting ATPase subunit delta